MILEIYKGDMCHSLMKDAPKRNFVVPLLTLSYPKVISLNTRRPAGENYVHIYRFNKMSTFCMSPLLTLSRPKVIHRKTLRPAGEDNIHIYKINKLSTFCISTTSSRFTSAYSYG